MADYRDARRLMKDRKIRGGSWGNLAMVVEAMNRGIEVTPRPKRPFIGLEHGGTSYGWYNGSTDFNEPLARSVGRYKDIQSRLFLNNGSSAPENAVFSPGQAQRAWAWGEPLGTLVVKPHDGTHGDSVHVGIDAWEDFSRAFKQVAAERGQVLVEKFHAGVEHRCLVVDSEFVAATRRRPASVKGDGASTIAELAAMKSRKRGKIHKKIQLGENERRYLAKCDLTFESVPKENERVLMRGTSNIHTGGDALDATDRVKPQERQAIEKAMRAIPGLRVAGLDVLLPRREHDSELTIIEINPAPMISMHHFPWVGKARNASGYILDAMFPETKQDAAT